MRIYMIRHGRQESRLCNVNVGLDPAGFRQAALVGERLAGKGIGIVYSSGLIRAEETAETANIYWNAERAIRPELREISFGHMEGLGDEEIAEKFKDFQAEQALMKTDLPYPGGECAADVVRRVLPFLEELKRCGHDKAAVVTHGGVIRSITAWILGMKLAEWRLLGSDLENSSITELSYDNVHDRFRLERFNDYAHLEKFPELLRENWKEDKE